MEIAPQPPFGVGRPEPAPPQTLAAADPIIEVRYPVSWWRRQRDAAASMKGRTMKLLRKVQSV
jgi:hypothetical protein